MKLRNKYRAQAVIYDGVRFHSRAEAARWAELKLLERGKKIDRLERQVKFPLTVNGHTICTYIADFTYYELDDDGYAKDFVVEDKKGAITPEFTLKAKLFHAVHGREIRIT